MAVKEILPFGDPILRKTAKPVEELTPRVLRMLDDLAETLYAADGRAGLAAPQVGLLRRLIVMDCGDGLVELINPVILEQSGEQMGTEGCLSYPGYYGNVKRANRVKVSTLNRQGETVIIEAEGYLARCIQHEVDHLDGVLFIDHMQEQWLFHESGSGRVPLLQVLKLSRPL